MPRRPEPSDYYVGGTMTETRPTQMILGHILTERNMQRERYVPEHDAALSDEEWDGLIQSRLTKPGASRYVRLVQVAALAVAAAEASHD